MDASADYPKKSSNNGLEVQQHSTETFQCFMQNVPRFGAKPLGGVLQHFFVFGASFSSIRENTCNFVCFYKNN